MTLAWLGLSVCALAGTLLPGLRTLTLLCPGPLPGARIATSQPNGIVVGHLAVLEDEALADRNVLAVRSRSIICCST